MSKSLEEVCSDLGHNYAHWKKYETAKNASKDEFFALADDRVTSERGLAVKTFTFTAHGAVGARLRAERHNPGWIIDILRETDEEGVWEASLVEDARYQAFSIDVDGFTYARQISRGSTMVDDEWIEEENPELFKEVTFELPWGERVMVPLENLRQEVLSRLRKYIYTGKPTVKLAAPKKVKEEE